MGGLRHQHLNAHWGDLTLLACRPMVPSPQMNVGESGSVTDWKFQQLRWKDNNFEFLHYPQMSHGRFWWSFKLFIFHCIKLSCQIVLQPGNWIVHHREAGIPTTKDFDRIRDWPSPKRSLHSSTRTSTQCHQGEIGYFKSERSRAARCNFHRGLCSSRHCLHWGVCPFA